MRKLLAAMKVTADEKITGPDGYADWVEDWSDEDYGLTSRVDACVLGGGMYPGYEEFWTAVHESPEKPLPMGSRLASSFEVEYARFATRTPHFVLSSTMKTARWPMTSFLRKLEDVAALKEKPGKDIYLVGGARTVSTFLDAGLIDELQLILYPLVAGEGKALFGATKGRRRLELRKVAERKGGRVSLVYGIGAP